MRTKQTYLNALMRCNADWVKSSYENPNKYMSQMHLVLHRLAYRKLTGKTLEA